MSSSSLNASVGASVSVVCSVQGDPPATTVWSFNGSSVSTSGLLELEDVSFAEAGQYSCEADNGYHASQEGFALVVYQLPTASVVYGNSSVLRGEEIRLGCYGVGSPGGQLFNQIFIKLLIHR